MAWLNFHLDWLIFLIKTGTGHFPGIIGGNTLIFFKFWFLRISRLKLSWRLDRFQQFYALISGGFRWIYSSIHSQRSLLFQSINLSISLFRPNFLLPQSRWSLSCVTLGNWEEPGAVLWAFLSFSRDSMNSCQLCEMFGTIVLLYSESPHI